MHQSVTCKNDSVKYQVLEEKSTVINFKPKTAESKLSERLKTLSLNTPTSEISFNHNSARISSQIPSLLDMPQVRTTNNADLLDYIVFRFCPLFFSYI